VFLQVDGNKDHGDDFNDTPSTLSLDTSESDRESSGDDALCSSQLSKYVSPGGGFLLYVHIILRLAR